MIDALGWRRVLSNATPIQPPDARLSRGLEVHPPGRGEEMELWLDSGYIRAGYGWSFPARDELRVGIGSFWPSHHVKDPTVRLAAKLGLPAEGYQGNWIPHQLRRAVEDGIFFAGDSAGHCLPLTAEGIRTAIYFGLACGRELRAVIEGGQTRAQALLALRRLLGLPRAQIPLAPLRPARDRADHPQPGRHRRDGRLREPPAVPLGLQPLPGDRPAVLRRRGPGGVSARANRRTPSSMAGSARLA